MAKDATALTLTHAVAAEMKKNPAKFGGTAIYEDGDRRFLETEGPEGPRMVELWFTIPMKKTADRVRAANAPVVKKNVVKSEPAKIAAAKNPMSSTRRAKKIAEPVLEEAAV